MTKKTRRIIFYSLILFFLLIAPILLIYAVGYKFDPVNSAIEKVGGIFVKSGTTTISIFLDNAFKKETSFISGGALLPEVDPGMHILRIEKAGYQPWSKTVSVEPSLVTELRNILLAPNPVIIATSTTEEISFLEATTSLQKQFELDKKSNLNKKEGNKKILLSSNVNSFEVIDGKIILVDKNGFLARVDPADGKTEIAGRPGFFLSSRPIRFVKSPAGYIVILDSSGGLFILEDSELSVIDGGISEIRFDKKGEKILLLKERKLEILWMKNQNYQPFQKKGLKEEILTLNTPILDARWFYDDNAHIIIRTDEGIYFTEIDGRGGRNTIELFSGKTEEIATVLETPESLFFKKSKNWYRVDL